MKIIDIHTHIYPDKIAEKTIKHLSQKGGCFSGQLPFLHTQNRPQRTSKIPGLQGIFAIGTNTVVFPQQIVQ